MKALVAIACSRDFSETDFLMQIGTWKIPVGWQVKFGWFKQFTAAERHNIALHEAKYNYDRVLFMDTDQIYPPEYIEMMLAHKEPVVTGLNVSRYSPYEFTTYKVDGELETEGVAHPKFVAMQPPPGERLFECDLTGTGALMIDPKAVEDLPLPYFKDLYDEAGCYRLLCDDFYLCWQLYKAGIPIMVDQNIVVKHIAKVTVSPANARDLRQAWDKVNSGFGYWKDGKK